MAAFTKNMLKRRIFPAAFRVDILTATQLVSRAVTIKVVTFAILAAVPLLWVVSLLALACAAHTVSVVAADVSAVVFAAGPVHVLCGHVVAAAFTLSAHAASLTPDTEGKVVILRGFQTQRNKTQI